MSERLIGFPTAWMPSDPFPQEIVRAWPFSPLRAILGVTGMTIHQLVASRTTKATVLGLFKAWREIERCEIADREKAYLEWLSWVKYLVPVEEWG